MRRSLFLLPLLLVLFSFVHLKTNAQKIYWTEGTQVRSANLDGSTTTTVFSDATNTPVNIELDIDNEFIFYQSGLEDLFYASLYDGSGKQPVANYGAFAGFTDFAIIPANEYVFMNFWQEGSQGGIDRTGYYDFPSPFFDLALNNPFDINDEEFNAIAADQYNEEVFFSVPVAGYGIYRTDMSGTSWTLIRNGIFGDVMEFDNRREKLYFVNSSNNQILRMNSNGSSFETVLNTVGTVTNLAINELDGSIYWVEGTTIKRAEYDGSNITNIVTGLSSPEDIEIYIDPGSILVTNTNDSGPGSLRAAIEGSNSLSGTQTIRFAIPGGGPYGILLSTPLPTITDAMILEGYTQTGSSANTQTDFNDADIRIELNGSSLSAGVALDIQAANVTISGLAIVGFPNNAIEVSDVSNVNIRGNFIGVRTDGATPAPNQGYGVFFSNTTNCTIGGSLVAQKNIISSNILGEIEIQGASSSGNRILGNFIGTDNTGQAGIASDNPFGITINEASNTEIGSANANDRNIIGDHIDGIIIKGSNATGTVVLGNSIGTDVNGLANIKNTSTGIHIHSGANNNTIGGINSGEGNLISFHDNHGVLVEGAATVSNSIRGNLISCSVADNISLTTNGNGDFAKPDITFISSDSIAGTALANALVDLYVDYSGCTEKGSSVYNATVTANGSGVWFFNTSGVFYPNDIVTAIATDPGNGNSSPFSNPQTIPLGFRSATLATTNQYVDLEFDFPAYGNSTSSAPVDVSDLVVNVIQNGGNPVSATILSAQTTGGSTLAGGEYVVRLQLEITGYPTGVEQLTFSAVDDNSIFDESGLNLLSTVISPSVTLNPAPVITNSTFEFDICPDGVFSLDLTADIAGTTFSWSAVTSSAAVSGVSASGTSDPISETISSTSATTETATYTIIPVFNTIEGEPVDFTVSIFPNPDVVFSQASETICSGTAPSITLSSTVDPSTTFSWTATASGSVTGFSDNAGTTINQTLTNSGTTTATVTYTVTPELNTCQGAPSDAIITVKPLETAQLTSTDFDICNEAVSFDLDISASGTGPWDITITDGTDDYVENNITTSPHSVAGIPAKSGATTYFVKSATDNSMGIGCAMNITGTDVTVTQIEALAASLEAGDQTICDDITSLDLPVGITGGGSGPWSIDYVYNGAPSTHTTPTRNTNINITPASGSSSFSITGLTDQSAPGCAASITNGNITITNIPTPSANLDVPDGSGAVSACQNGIVQLEISFTGTGPWEIVLDDGINQETLQLSNNPSILDKTVTQSQDFSYSLLSVKSVGGNCSGSVSGNVDVTVTPIPGTPGTNAISGPTEVCHGLQNVAYSVTAIPGATEYEWSFTNGVGFSAGSPATAQNIELDFPTNITATQISVRGRNACGAGINEAVLNVKVDAGPANPGPITGVGDICQGAQDVGFSIPSISNVTGYVWILSHQNGSATERYFTSAPDFAIDFTANFAGATLQAAGYNSCDTSNQKSQKTLNALSLPSAAQTPSGPALVCSGSEISVSVASIENASQYVWNLPAGVSPAQGTHTTNLSSISLIADSPGNFTINVHGQNQCGSGSQANAAFSITIESSPELTITAPASAYLGQTIEFLGTETSGQTINSWQWDFGDGNSSSDQNTTHIYFKGGVRNVTLTASNSAQCESVVLHPLEVINELPVEISNVITPNGDGSNDGIFIEGLELFDQNEVILLNRMGVRVLAFDNYRNNWAEVFNGPPLKAGNYVVIFKLKGTDLSKKQTVTVLN